MKPRLAQWVILEIFSGGKSDILYSDNKFNWVVVIFFTESVYDMIEEETYQFALKVKNKLDYNAIKDEMRTFIRFPILWNCHTLPSDRGYMAEAHDLGVTKMAILLLWVITVTKRVLLGVTVVPLDVLGVTVLILELLGVTVVKN